MSSFGDGVQKARKAKGLSQQALADKAGMDRGNLSKIENGRGGIPTEQTIKRLTDALEITVADLMRYSGWSFVKPGVTAEYFVESLEEEEQEEAKANEYVEPTVRLSVTISHRTRPYPHTSEVAVSVPDGRPINRQRAIGEINEALEKLSDPYLYAVNLLIDNLLMGNELAEKRRKDSEAQTKLASPPTINRRNN
jgi:transcriptional regulator with XRE-family HTH domain